MKTLVLDKRAPLSSDDMVVFHQKPNVILYSFEATKIIILFIVGLNVVQVVGLHFLRHASLIFLVKLTLLIDSLLLPIFLFVVLLIASGLTFIVTRTDVGIRFRPFGIEAWHLCVPIQEIESVRVGTYGTNYGSVYLSRRPRGAQASASMDFLGAQAPGTAWLSMPWSWPPLVGFYGFRHYDQLVHFILELYSHQLNRASSR